MSDTRSLSTIVWPCSPWSVGVWSEEGRRRTYSAVWPDRFTNATFPLSTVVYCGIVQYPYGCGTTAYVRMIFSEKLSPSDVVLWPEFLFKRIGLSSRTAAMESPSIRSVSFGPLSAALTCTAHSIRAESYIGAVGLVTTWNEPFAIGQSAYCGSDRMPGSGQTTHSNRSAKRLEFR
jgi:hypothetical protein